MTAVIKCKFLIGTVMHLLLYIQIKETRVTIMLWNILIFESINKTKGKRKVAIEGVM